MMPNLHGCRHCRNGLGNYPRRLCRACYNSRAIRGLYESCSSISPDNEEERTPLVERKAGDATHRCLWCHRWLCDGPLQKCVDCWRKYERELARCGGLT